MWRQLPSSPWDDDDDDNAFSQLENIDFTGFFGGPKTTLGYAINR